MKSSVQDEKFSKIKSKCCALKKNIFAIKALQQDISMVTTKIFGIKKT